MKSVLVSLLFLLASIVVSLTPRPARGAESESPRSATTPFSTCPINETDSASFFVPGKEFKVNDGYTIHTFRTRTPTADLQNVVAVLTKNSRDTDVEIPRVSVIYYDGSPTSVVGVSNKGDITIPSTAGKTVQIMFCLQGLSNKTDWKYNGTDWNDAILVAGPSLKPIAHAPTTQGKWPCTGMSKAVTKSGHSISFPMCSKNDSKQDIYYSYGLHMDQIGSDTIGVDVGIDPQIINKAVVGP